MRKVLLVCITLIMFACNSQPNSKIDKSKPEHAVEVSAELPKEADIPPKPEKLTWFFLVCEYTGTYNANEYSEEQLENTLKWLIKGYGTSKPFGIYKPTDLKHTDKEEVEQEFNEILNKLTSLEFVNTTSFNKIKQKRIDEIKRLKLLSLMQIESYSNPEVLKNDDYSVNHCSEYTNALIAGGDQLLALRKKMAEESKEEGNSSAWKRYIEETKADNQLEFARVFVSTFGWWNCVNASIERTDPMEVHESVFLKLFKDVTKECEMP